MKDDQFNVSDAQFSEENDSCIGIEKDIHWMIEELSKRIESPEAMLGRLR